MSSTLLNSQIHDETTFYKAFLRDLAGSKKEVFIESPFITTQRMEMIKPILQMLVDKGVEVTILTRRPEDHDEILSLQSELAIRWCERAGIQVLLCDNNSHRKLAILDRKVLWEGSLNILSQTHSREFMRRIENRKITMETFEFLRLQSLIYPS